MSEWWSFVGVFWALYLADALSGGRRERLFLSAWRGRPGCRPPWRRRRREATGERLRRPGTAEFTQASWHLTPLGPWAWTLPLADLPLSFTADGVVNQAALSTARPPPRADFFRALRWEDVGKVETRAGWLWVGGARLAPATEAMDGKGLQALAGRLAALPREAREAEIAVWWRARLSPLRARRRLASALARTRGLGLVNTLQAAGWLALSVALLSGHFVPVAAEPGRDFAPWREPWSAQSAWWLLLAWLLCAHVFSILEAWSVHRRLHPARREERSSLIFSALLMPPQALRMRAALLRPLALEFSPLAAALAAGSRECARAAAADTLRDLRYPARPASLPEFFVRQTAAAAALAGPELERVLAAESAAGRPELAPARLLAAPEKLPRGACAWCPRCGDAFARADGTCPHGVELRRVAPAGPE